MRRALVILVLLLGASTARAQTIDPKDLIGVPEVSAAASPSQVQLGARLVLVVTAAYDEGAVVNILPPPLDLGPQFEERRRTTTDSVRADGKHVREWQIELIAWDLGDIEIPPVQVTVTRGGAAEAVATNPVPIHVTGALGDMVDTTQPRGDAPPVALWKRTWLWVSLAIAVVVFALIALITWFASRRMRARRRRDPDHPVPQPVRVHAPAGITGLFRRPRLGGTAEEALARLEAIDTSGMLERDRKAAYAEMVDVMQVFLGRQLGADLEDATIGELRAWVHDSAIAAPTRDELGRWLLGCELVKFGGVQPPVDEGRADLAAAREIVIAVAMPSAALTAPPPVEEPARA